MSRQINSKDGSGIHKQSDEDNLEWLQAQLSAVYEGSANWEAEYSWCRELLEKIVTLRKDDSVWAKSTLDGWYLQAEEFLKKFQHFD